ncbi:MAG TPA: undecaprenyl-diphosphate phosphatase [Haloplasmataceae bacterium]
MTKLLEILKYLLLGAIQGITETLPISSSGHLIILSSLLGIERNDDLTFEILLHFGSLIAVIYFYRKTLLKLIKSFFSYLFKKDKDCYTDFKYVWLLALATIPAALIGYFFQDYIGKNLANLLTVGVALIITSVILYVINKMPKGTKQKENITWLDAISVGIIQAIAIIPGISRSGSTVSMGLARKFNIENAVQFSFFLFIPVTLGATIIDIIHFLENPIAPTLLIPYIIAFLTSIIFTYISLKIFINVIKKGKLVIFSIYCLIVGILSIVLNFI